MVLWIYVFPYNNVLSTHLFLNPFIHCRWVCGSTAGLRAI